MRLHTYDDWRDEDWTDFYYLGGTNIIDAAVLWKESSYLPDTFMCLSFQFRKHLTTITPDVDMTCVVDLDDGTEQEITVPVTVQFFWPDAGV